MRSSLLPLLRCPNGCAGALMVDGAAMPSGDILEGTLRCAICGSSYPIEEGIPRMLPADLLGDSASGAAETVGADRKRSEMRARDEQVGDYDRMWYLNIFGAVELPATLCELSLQSEHRLLEAGCGTGRMTREFAVRCRNVVCIDFSWESLRVCAAKCRAAGVLNADLVQADICRLPFVDGAFDRVVSCQVLEHVPGAACREAAVASIARVAAAGAVVTVSAYQYNWLMRLARSHEGEHEGGIYFYRFTRRELADLLGLSLRVEGMTGALLYHYIARCRKEAA